MHTLKLVSRPEQQIQIQGSYKRVLCVEHFNQTERITWWKETTWKT